MRCSLLSALHSMLETFFSPGAMLRFQHKHDLMKSNQRWLKLRTTVQLSGALSSSMNRVKPPLKREDSFITRFSTRQIAELQDTVDQTDIEDSCKNSSGSPNKTRRKWKKRHHRTVINPYGNAYFYWLCILTICVLYNLWTAIVRQSFPQLQDRNFIMWCVLDILTDMVLVLDIIVQYRTGYLEQGLIVYDSQKLASHYRNSRCFVLDMVAVIPIDYLVMSLFPSLNKNYPMFRCPRFLKVYRVYNYYYMVESRTLYPNLWRVVNLIHILLLLAHWFGCFYFILSKAENFQGDWVYPLNSRPEFGELSRQYLGSVYWSTLTLTTIGDLPTPETNQQYIFTIVSYLIGVFIFATIVGQVGNVITNRNANRLEFERLLDGAKLYMRHHKVPREMQRRVQRWYDYSWSRGRIQGGGDINSALGLLPDKLRTELALHVNLCTLKKVSIFKECQPEFLHDLVLKMKAYIFTPGDLICRKGEVAREMFIIADGILEVISETGKVLTTMKAGDFFGEIGILNLDGLNKRTADVRSVGYSELFSLSREDVLTAMKDYPEAQEILQSLGRKRLMDARHNSKSGSSSSSKHDSPSPTRENGPDERQAKKIVSRIRSDVSAIRNAFRKSRGMTREMETVELEPLTSDGKSSTETEGPVVKRLLRRLARDDGSCSSETSTGTTRGVLKRMAKVTSDDTQPITASQPKAFSVEETQGVLGAGLPLIQRLKLLKEKEDREERERAKKEENQKQNSNSLSVGNKLKVEVVEEEPEVIGAGLPLFARLKLLKAKEDKEKQEREKAMALKTRSRENSCDLKSTNNSDNSKVKSDSGDTSISSTSKKSPLQLKGMLRKAVLEKSANGDHIIVSNTCGTDQINDLNKDTVSGKDSIGNNNTIATNKEIFTKSSSITSINNDKINKDGEENKNKMPLESKKSTSSVQSEESDSSVSGSQKEKLQRSDSFKRAMGEGLLGTKNNSDLNIKNISTNKLTNKDRLRSTSSSSSSKRTSVDDVENKQNVKKTAEVKLETATPGLKKTENILTTKSSQDDRSPDDNVNKRTLQPDFLKVPSDEISPPLSSPESSDTPERKSLKSILKKMSREDSRTQLLPGPDLKKLMRAPTIEGFVARRSKFNKSVSFQRRTLNSPPFRNIPDDGGKKNSSVDETRGNSRNILSRQTSLQHASQMQKQINAINVGHRREPFGNDGMNKLLTKLSVFGMESEESTQTEALVHGVRKILQEKMEDVEVAWESRLAAMEQEIVLRDVTINRLRGTIARLRGANMSQDLLDNVDDSITFEDSLHDTQTSGTATTERTNSIASIARVRDSEHLRSASLDASNSGSDEDEPLFMRCTSIESIIHQSPDSSLCNREDSSPQPLTWPQPRYVDDEMFLPRQYSVTQGQQQQHHQLPPQRTHSIIDMESSTDDDLFSFSSDDEHIIYTTGDPNSFNKVEISDGFEEFISDEDDDEEPLENAAKVLSSDKLNSKDWEVQMLAQKLAEEQRGVARRVDRDIAAGKFRSDLAEVHSALATDNIDELTDCDVVRLEKLVRRERENLKRFARLYSLDERPVLKEEFCPLYRTRSQQLLSRSSEFSHSKGTAQKRLSRLLSELVSLPLTEQFLLDRLLYSHEKSKRLAKQRSLCDDQLSSYGARRLAGLRSQDTHGNLVFRRSQSMCSPPSSHTSTPRRGSVAKDEWCPVSERGPAGETGPPTVSAKLATMQRSATVTSNSSRNSSQCSSSHFEKQTETFTSSR